MKKLFIFVLFIFTLFNLTPFKTFAETTSNTYYVDSRNGNDNNTGTSVNQALKNIEKAYEKASESGDTICVIGIHTFPSTTSLPPKSVKITSLSSKGIIYFRDSVSINADTVFENIDLGFMYLNEDGGRAIYANGHNLTIGQGVDTNYQQGIKYPSIYGGSRTESISASPNITVISGEFDTVYAGGYNNYTVTDTTINLKSNGTLQLANVDASSVLNPDNVVINYVNSGSKVSNKVNVGGGTVNFTGTNTDLKYPIENVSQILMINSTLNIYENGSFRGQSQNKLNFILDNNSKLEVRRNDPFNIDGDFEGHGTINFGPNSYLNISGKVSGQTKITQLFTASRRGIVSANLGTEDNFYLNDDNYCQIEFEQNSDSVKWNIIIPSEAPKTYYVNGAAEKQGDGSSIESPLKTIEEAIEISENGSYIYICGDTDVSSNLDIDKYVIISGMENAKLNFASENLSINIIYGEIVFESNLNITGHVPDIYMEFSTAILNGGEFNKIYALEEDTSELEIKGSLINSIENIDSVTMTEYGENNNFAVVPNLTNVRLLAILSSYVDFNGSSVDIQNLIVKNSTINIIENTSISGAANLGDYNEGLPIMINILSGKRLEFQDSMRALSDIFIDVIGDPDESIYLVFTEIGGSGIIKSASPNNYEFEELNDEISTSYKLKRNPEYIAPVSNIKLDKSNISLDKGETEKITATVLPEYAADKLVYWISSDNNIATVDEDGNVKAISKGVATITSITNDGNKTSDCVVNVSEKVIDVTSIELDKTNLSLQVGESQKITAKVLPENSTVKGLDWKSSNPKVATVDNAGNITAISKGTATITVSSGNVSSDCVVNVSEKVIDVTSIELDKTNLSLQVGESQKITAKVLPEDSTVKSLDWKSSNPEVATVDNAGNVIAISKGIATITVSSGNVSSDCVVNVSEKVIDVTSIELDKTNLSLQVGESQKITAKVLPEDSTVKSLDWKSSNPEVATVDNAGNVIAISKGIATITVSSGNVSSDCVVNVSEKVIDVTSIELDKTNLSLQVGEIQKITAKVLPEDSTVKGLDWKSSNPEVATVDNAGNITAISKGTATITVSSGNVSSDCVVNVSEKIIDVTSIELDKTNLSLQVGESQKITAKILPENSTVKGLDWKSSNPEVATVDNAGNVKAISKGTATITVSSGDVSSDCVVNVSEKVIDVTSIKLDKTNLSLQVGEIQKITAKVLPEDSTVKGLDWKSSNPEVATVDNAGNVIAISKGTATITVSSGNVSSDCVVNVSEKVIDVTSIELDKTNLSLQVGEIQKIIAKVLPEDSTVKGLDWKSSNPEVATVDNAGNITAISKGTATITVSSGNVSSDCVVNVSEKVIDVTSIELDKTNLSLQVGEIQKITAKVLPEDSTVKGLDWKSSNPEVATVDNAGNVIAISKGTATITVSSYNGTIKSYCNINVYTISNAEIELYKTIEEANEVLKDSNSTTQSLLKEIVKLSRAIKNLRDE